MISYIILCSFVCSCVFAASGPVISNVKLDPAFITNSKAQGRDSGKSAPVNGHVLWVFDDSFTPAGLRSATGAWADNPSEPWKIREDVDSGGSPYQFYPFTPSELAYNKAQSSAPACCHDQTSCPDTNRYCHCAANVDCVQRIAFWNEKPYQANTSSVLLIYRALKIGNAPFDFRNQGMGIAHVTYPSTVSTRVMSAPNEPLYVFGPDEPEWDSTVMADGYIYFHSETNAGICTSSIRIARVEFSKVTQKSSYQYYNNGQWSSNAAQASSIGNFPAGLGSVMYSSYLKSFLSFNIGLCNGPKSFWRTAPNPWGPWSDATTVDMSGVGAVSGSYAGELHEELSSGSTVVVSFFTPAPNFSGAIRMRSATVAMSSSGRLEVRLN